MVRNRTIRNTTSAAPQCPRWIVASLAVCLLVTGCGRQGLDSTYGRRRGLGATSVAGTSVLSEMIEQRGAQVATWSRISPKLDQYDVIFWFPDDFSPPTLEQRVALDDWLINGLNRTLVYVGRDFDAATAYWESVLPDVEAEQWEEASNRIARSEAFYASKRQLETGGGKYARWFTVQADSPPAEVVELSSDFGWEEGISVDRVDLRVETRLRQPTIQDLKTAAGTQAPPNTPVFTWELEKWEAEQYQRVMDRTIPDSRVLLDSNAGPLVREVADPRWGDSQVLVVANGGFLLNLPLVNYEHRKLASRLLDEAEVDDRQVVFLESGAGGPPVYHEEPEDSAPTGLELFTVWPIGMIMLHLLGLGVLACFVLFPNFGRARSLPQQSPSDFGQHINAVGELLSHTKSQSYVTEQLQNYHLVVKRESGISHTVGEQDTVVEAESTAPPKAPPTPEQSKTPDDDGN